MNRGNEADEDWIGQLRSLGVLKPYAAGDPILFQGETAKTIGLVMSGAARASVFSETGQETWIGEFVEGELFGHVSILTDTEIDFEIVAQTETQILKIPVKKFRELIHLDNQLAERVSRDLAARLDRMTTRLIEAVTLSAPGRVCAELMRQSKPVGIAPDKMIIRPSPVFLDVALYVNSTRETVSRTVNALLKDGVLSREAGAILIDNPDTLKARVK